MFVSSVKLKARSSADSKNGIGRAEGVRRKCEMIMWRVDLAHLVGLSHSSRGLLAVGERVQETRQFCCASFSGSIQLHGCRLVRELAFTGCAFA